MGIPIITGFDLNSNSPIDSRMVATSSDVRNAIVYKYPGLKVYQTDNNITYTWNGSSWGIEGNNGIYGGSGSLIGDTFIDTGVVSATSSTTSYVLGLKASSSTDVVYQNTEFLRHTSGSGWSTIAVKQVVKHSTGAGMSPVGISYITHNPYDSRGSGYEGGLEFGTSNTKRFTLTSDGLIRMWSPTHSADFLTSGLTGSVSYILPSKSGTLALIGDLQDLNLQSITDAGNSTTNNIDVVTSTGTSFLRVRNSSNQMESNLSISPSSGSSILASYDGNNWWINILSSGASNTLNSIRFKQSSVYGDLFFDTLTSIRNIKFPDKSGTVVVDEGQSWTNILSFGSVGWSATTDTPRYTKDANGNVWLQGTLNSSSVTFGSGSPIFTLPSGYRPSSQTLRFPCWYLASGVYYTAYVHVDSTGKVYIPTTSAPSATGQLTISPIIFTTL